MCVWVSHERECEREWEKNCLRPNPRTCQFLEPSKNLLRRRVAPFSFFLQMYKIDHARYSRLCKTWVKKIHDTSELNFILMRTIYDLPCDTPQSTLFASSHVCSMLFSWQTRKRREKHKSKFPTRRACGFGRANRDSSDDRKCSIQHPPFLVHCKARHKKSHFHKECWLGAKRRNL